MSPTTLTAPLPRRSPTAVVLAALRYLNPARYRLRLLFRGAFLLLALATVAMALYVLQEEKRLSYQNYQASFHKTEAQIAARLRHPAGQLALLNPPAARGTGQHPLVLPFSALDFDDQHKVQQAVEMAGCLVQYPASGSLCVAIGNNPWAGGFIYVAGSFAGGNLVAHPPRTLDLAMAHRVRITASLRGQTYRWIAPFETTTDADLNDRRGRHGRLTGFLDGDDGIQRDHPVKDFRGWVWQDPQCLDTAGAKAVEPGCVKRAFYSVRLPVAVLQDELFRKSRPVWPPADLDQIRVHVEVLPPGSDAALFDSDRPGGAPPFSLADLQPLLLPGETLQLHRLTGSTPQPLLTLTGASDPLSDASRLIDRVIRRLPVEGYDQPLTASDTIATPVGSYRMTLTGDVRSVNRSLAVVATRVSWFVGAMLLALLVAWFVIELGIIRRITVLTSRARAVSRSMKGVGSPNDFDLADLRGADELGVLAAGLSDLLQRVKEDVERERIRTEQEKDMWHAVGHEIMSPLQSLLALHGERDDDSRRYLSRMQQAIRVLYGSASPSEAFQSTTLDVTTVDLAAFLRNVADNAPCVGIPDVRYLGEARPVMVRADDYSLEDVVTHILRNAARYRTDDTPITVTLQTTDTATTVTIHNQGPAIPDELIDKIFEYGVSDQQDAGANGNRGQGLFVAKTYMAKMGGTISAQNVEGGVSFVLGLQRVG